MNTIEKSLGRRFVYSRNTGNAYDTNHWYWFDGDISVKFRGIDEVALLEYNDATPDTIDEYVVHPDGTLTGCWDRDRKLLIKGGCHAEQAIRAKAIEESRTCST